LATPTPTGPGLPKFDPSLVKCNKGPHTRVFLLKKEEKRNHGDEIDYLLKGKGVLSLLYAEGKMLILRGVRWDST